MAERSKKGEQRTLHSRVTRAIWRAVILELSRAGYQGLSMEQVARRAGVGKAALYRRWSGKEAMVLALIETIDLPTVQSEDKGSLQADLLDYLKNAGRLLRRPLMRRILPEFYAEMSRGGPLGDALRVKLLGLKSLQVQELVERARRRGEIGNLPHASLASALIIGPIYWLWMIEQRPLDESLMQGMAMSLASALSSYAQKPELEHNGS